MSTREPRAGIERKILTSILWVGILPMTVALIVGYITARSAQSNAVQQTLTTAAQKTAEGIYLVRADRLRLFVSGLARDPHIIGALRNARDGGQPGDNYTQLLDERFVAPPSPGPDGPTVVGLFNPQLERVYTSGPETAGEGIQLEDVRGLDGPRFLSFGYSPTGGGIGTQSVTPVLDNATGELLGYLSVVTSINSLLSFAMGNPGLEGSEPPIDHYQVVYVSEDGAMLGAELSEGPLAEQLPLKVFSLDPVLEEKLSGRPVSDAMMIFDYQTENQDPELDVLLAFYKIPGQDASGDTVYLVVYRDASQVFSAINLWAVLAITGCMLFIAFLCINAYRDVHNNIVRPVSLLNEGAQIVRQGDFDLKLKIETGDEIEELALSFNKMALALKHNIKQLEASEENYRSLVNTMRDGIYQTNLQGDITFLNPSGVEILGFPGEEEAIRENFDELFLEDIDMDPETGNGDERDQGGRRRIWMKRWDDKTICVELTRSFGYNDDGLPIGMEGLFRDVTKNVQLEEEARERAERISTINQIANVINSSLEAGRLYESLVVELKKIVDFDYAAVALLAENGDEFDGRQLWPDEEVEPGYTFTLDTEHSCAAWVARERKCLVVDNLREGHSSFAQQFPEDVQSCLCVPLYATGRIIGTLNLGNSWPSAFSRHDVEVLERMGPHLAVAIRNAQLLVNLQLSLEEVTRAREKLHEAHQELKTLDEMKTNLLSNVSHELRTPLVAVMGYNDMILNGKAGPINKTQQDYLEISLRNIEKLVTLIENLLDFSRLHRGDEHVVFDVFDLVDCARMSIQIVQPVADERRVVIELYSDETPILVEGDKGKMGQVFNNLLSNAVKFNHNGGKVKIEMSLGEDSVEIKVKDTGIGIPEEALEKIFTRFYQYDASSTRKYGGTGIGLSIAQDIARLHGSSISATSVVDEGTEFRFRLNLANKGKTITAAPERQLPAPAETHLLIELVTADRALGSQVRNLLMADGMDVIHASTAEAAITLTQKYRPDCMLVDVVDVESGRALMDALLEDSITGALPIVMLTNDEEAAEIYRSLLSARVKRSFRKSSLLSGIQHALNQGHEEAVLAGEKVLCVDDDPEILVFMSRCLKAEGYKVECCKSGEEALAKLEEGDFGLLLLDIAMPGMDGWGVCETVRSNPDLDGIKIYLVTAKPIDRDLSRVHDSGADGFLLKPFRPEDLVQLVQGLELHTSAKPA